MKIERTLSIIKPDGVGRSIIGDILNRFERAGLKIAALKMVQLSKKEAEGFYAVHRGKAFFDELTAFMASGPIVISILEGEKAILKNREIMGATNPQEAAPGTIRSDYSASIGQNTIHGSDAEETAAEEIAYFFSRTEQVN